MGFQITIDISSKLNWCFFFLRLALKENIKMYEKMLVLNETKNKVTEITYKEKCFLEFQINKLRFVIKKGVPIT